MSRHLLCHALYWGVKIETFKCGSCEVAHDTRRARLPPRSYRPPFPCGTRWITIPLVPPLTVSSSLSIPFEPPCSKQISITGITVPMNFPDVEATLGQCFLCLCQRTSSIGRGQLRGGRDLHRLRPRGDLGSGWRDGSCCSRCIEKPLCSVSSAFFPNAPNIGPESTAR